MGDDPEARDNRAGQGIERVSALLRGLAQAKGAGARLTDLSRSVGLSKSTVHRILASLVQQELVEQDPRTGTFFLGYELVRLGLAAADRSGLLSAARPAMERLEGLCHDSVYLCVPAQTDSLCLERLEGRFPIKVLTQSPGERRPLGVGASSVALLAAMPADEAAEIVARNAAIYADYGDLGPDRVREQVAQARLAGFAFNDALLVPEMASIACAVRGPDGRPAASLSIKTTSGRLAGERRGTLLEALRVAAAEVERNLGVAARH